VPSQLEYDDDGGRQRVVHLSDQEVLIGRLAECAIRTADGTVTRRHARVVYRDGRYRIEDLGSDNGTWVNGGRVKSRALQPNDSIQCGRLQLRYVEDDRPPS
jgi:pSer/pThr/pTyr-binding forkhead associated (FHA) protein